MSPELLTPFKAAYRLTHVLNVFTEAHQTPRFPVNVESLALETAKIFGWSDPIVEVQAAAIPSLEGALIPDGDRRKWMLLYDDRVTSRGRVRFTQAHELGHYVLHRLQRDSFECTEKDMVTWNDDSADIEAQADTFAATLLMPLDDFREQVDATANFESLGVASTRYGMSLTAATLRWLDHTDAVAVLVIHRDGFIMWAHSSKPAMRTGAFFRSRARTVPIPAGSLAEDDLVSSERRGKEIDARIWFPHAEQGASLLEMKIHADQYDWTMTLLVLPKGIPVWEQRSR